MTSVGYQLATITLLFYVNFFFFFMLKVMLKPFQIFTKAIMTETFYFYIDMYL